MDAPQIIIEACCSQLALLVDESAPYAQRNRIKAEILSEKAKISKRTKEKDNYYGSAAANLYEDVSSSARHVAAAHINS